MAEELKEFTAQLGYRGHVRLLESAAGTILVELDDDAPAELLSATAIYAARKGFAGAVDIIPCRAGVLASRARAIGSFAHVILRDGVTVYERT